MTEKQRRFFFRDLWPKACRAQGWTGTETERRDMVRKATQGKTDSMSACTQPQLTAVFNYTKWLADPGNVELARAVANPEEAAISDECRQYIFKINELGFTSAYVQQVAEWDCRVCSVSEWQRLPVEKGGRAGAEGLRRVLIHLTKRRNQKKLKPEETGPAEIIEYQMKPRKTFTPARRSEPAENPF